MGKIISSFWLQLAASALLGLLFIVWPALSRAVSLPQVVDGVRYAFGQEIIITEPVNGDLIVAAGNVVVRAEIQGDLLVAGGNIRVESHVAGNIRALGGNLTLASTVGRNVLAVAGTVAFLPPSHILGHVTAVAGSLNLGGLVEGSVGAAAGQAALVGTISGPADLWLERGAVLEVKDTASLAGRLTYHASRQASVSNGAKLSQPPVFESYAATSANSYRRGWWLGRLGSLFGALVLGMVVVRLIPRKLEEVTTEALIRPWPSLGWGLAWAVGGPLTSLLLLVTIIGLPLAVALLAFYVLGLVVTPVVAGATIARYILSWPQFKTLNNWPLLASVSLGIVVFRVLTSLPWLGSILLVLGVIWSWGALIRVQRRTLAGLA
ncbi:MAG: polymer-forming cytoskeletal protein [Candidatus Kerfeldbacteria bacterium]|nr:polymer-forming cytoskeletal protein [Candidatus Kerfeldbacteria bacterium]